MASTLSEREDENTTLRAQLFDAEQRLADQRDLLVDARKDIQRRDEVARAIILDHGARIDELEAKLRE